MAYYKLNPPFDPWFAWASIMALIWNVNRSSNNAAKKAADFMPQSKRPRHMTEDEIKNQIFASGMVK